MRLTLTSLVAAVLVSGAVSRPADAAVIPLSNAAITVGEICANFDCVTFAGLLEAPFSFPSTIGDDGGLTSVVLAGNVPATTGLFLYGYSIASFATSPEGILGLTVPFEALAPPGFSFVSGAVGTVPTVAASYDDILALASFFFDPVTTLLPGETSNLFGALSTLPPVLLNATVQGRDTGVSANALVPASVPEPVTLLLLGAGGLAVAARKRYAG